jgi:hypothetical protein
MSVSAALPITYGVPSLLSIWPRHVRIVSTAENREDLRLNQLSTVGLLRLARQDHARMWNDKRAKLELYWSRG